MTNIFSTYSQAENLVPSSITAAIRPLSLDRIERILGAFFDANSSTETLVI